MQVDAYKDKDGNNKSYNYLLVEELEYLEKKKEETNEFQDLKTKTEVTDQFDYNASDLPF